MCVLPYLDVLPDCIDDVWTSGCVNAEESGQFASQLVLNGLQRKK